MTNAETESVQDSVYVDTEGTGDYSYVAQESEAPAEHVYTDADGVQYIWDYEKQIWLPQVDDDLIAQFQNSYGPPVVEEPDKSVAPTTQIGHKRQLGDNGDTAAPPSQKPKLDSQQKPEDKPAHDSKYLETPKEKNPNVYISGLPIDITSEELLAFMSKCGIIKLDDEGKPRIKIYKDAQGNPKGDGLCTYLKVESVDLALDMLNKAQIKPGVPLTMQRAKFEKKGDKFVDKKKKKNTKKKPQQAKGLSWEEQGSSNQVNKKAAAVVILKHMFDPNEFDDDPVAITDISEDVRNECTQCGEVRKVIVFDRHTDGVVSVRFGGRESAEKCIKLMHGRWFGGKRILAEHWDGKTDYKVEENEHEKVQRLKQWDTYLEGAKSGVASTEPAPSSSTGSIDST
ncbi:hypothetical protein SARC_03758 [Sphaeroforma arctica JP610]|uniref:RRM domain-containing protein n=1 Tax=Sphaeroforma arctica JP610 TaxID=667725 RepID=A0A0L0G4I5_9EUKA|nr:hypothetical protein SARC_03758 [Sphaeroforma arctica JP610]KNC83997.1 hypothetical protein SARC_03758 [Sphaeroforma arctica JP610]|eukprot:XP_014157899.1 hypothetical protein SARC_03758 [Sphaeroforma arctica JP610]